MTDTTADEHHGDDTPTMSDSTRMKVDQMWKWAMLVISAVAAFWFYQTNSDTRQLKSDLQSLRESVVRLETKMEYVVRSVDDNPRVSADKGN